MNDTQKEMAENAKAFAVRKVALEKALADGALEKKKIQDDANLKIAAIDARIRAIASGDVIPASKDAKHA